MTKLENLDDDIRYLHNLIFMLREKKQIQETDAPEAELALSRVLLDLLGMNEVLGQYNQKINELTDMSNKLQKLVDKPLEQRRRDEATPSA